MKQRLRSKFAVIREFFQDLLEQINSLLQFTSCFFQIKGFFEYLSCSLLGI